MLIKLLNLVMGTLSFVSVIVLLHLLFFHVYLNYKKSTTYLYIKLITLKE